MGKQNQYSWASYYEEACARQKAHNRMQAARLAEAEARQEDLSLRVNRICDNPFWKLSAPLRKLYHGRKTAGIHPVKTDRSSQENPCLMYYQEEIDRQRHPYLQWIAKEEPDYQGKDCIFTPTDGKIWKIAIPETDICLYGYGEGALSSGTFSMVTAWFEKHPSYQMAYPDEDYYWDNPDNRMQPWLKPCYSPDTLLSFNYFGHVIAVKGMANGLERIGNPENTVSTESAGHSTGMVFYDLCLRLEEQADKIGHIETVLFHNKCDLSADKEECLQKCSTGKEKYRLAQQYLQEELEAGKGLIGAGKEGLWCRRDALARRGFAATLKLGAQPDIYHVVYESGAEAEPLVSVIIPSKDHPEVLKQCMTSFLEKTAYRNVEFIVVDNGSTPENRKKIEEELMRQIRETYGILESRLTYLYEAMPFNFSKMCNLGATRAQGALLLFLNDDIEIIERSWLGRMVGQAMQPAAGAVGAKLWYAGTEQIQHAGITNLGIGPSHKLITFPDDRDYYYGHNRVTYDMIGVTAACLLVTKEKYEQTGGMDESMAVAYNDVDFCFKLAERGYYNVLRNDAVLYHHESLSRGLDEQDDGKWERLLQEKENLYGKHAWLRGYDPFYHKALIDNASDYSCNYKFPYEEHLKTVRAASLSADFLQGGKELLLQLTVDRAEKQHKIHWEEPDILWIMGWNYIPGVDNAAYTRQLILQRSDGSGYRAVPADWYRKDVEAILPGEKNIGLAGFVLRLLQTEIAPGEYRIGMLCTEERAGREGQKLLAWSDKKIVV